MGCVNLTLNSPCALPHGLDLDLARSLPHEEPKAAFERVTRVAPENRN